MHSSNTYNIDEDLKIAIHVAIDRFQKDDTTLECDFPSSFTGAERAYIHRKCSQMGLISKSHGRRTNRYLTIRKKQPNEMMESPMMFRFGQNSQRILHTLLSRWPVKQKERQDIQPKMDRPVPLGYLGYRSDINKPSGRLPNGIPQVPTKCTQSNLDDFQKKLPVYEMKNTIVKTIWDNSVVLICGASGAGKTTQIPQFILEESLKRNEVCRIVCTQPRRISAVSMAERVALECGESVGQTVGYQIRLESRASPRTLLTFCTNGVLLRTLMAGDAALQSITHVIIDEVHERDRFCDFLLIKLRKLLMSRKPQFRLILVSDAVNAKFLQDYFSPCPLVKISGNLHDVKEIFLEEILSSTGHLDKNIKKLTDERNKRDLQRQKLNKWLLDIETRKKQKLSQEKKSDETDVDVEVQRLTMDEQRRNAPHAGTAAFSSRGLDKAIFDAWHGEDQAAFDEILHLIVSENAPANHRHCDTGVTPLMTMAAHGMLDQAEQLVALGADPCIKSPGGTTAKDMAQQGDHSEIIELLSTLCRRNIQRASSSDENNLLSLHRIQDVELIDFDLLMTVLRTICSSSDQGAILVFLPGYDEIVVLCDRVMGDCDITTTSDIRLFTLHAGMQSHELKEVYSSVPAGTRKIILATNIAESAVTISDVVFVVDTGKIVRQVQDSVREVNVLKHEWISRASAAQRAEKSALCRPGVCYRLYSTDQYAAMVDGHPPELLCTPLHELCLHVKLLDECSPIAQYFQHSLNLPANSTVNNAVNLLKTMDALDQFENLTELGQHLVDLPIEPRLGKMILYSVVLKCLDPILTIACSLSHKDPFIVPLDASVWRKAMESRTKFAAGTFSDHMCLLRAFQAWQKARSDGWEKEFCQKHFMSQAAMEKIVGMRSQLLGQLRATGFVRARGGSDIRDLNTNSENWAVVKAALCASLYPNILRADRKFKRLSSRMSKRVRFHHTSVLSQPVCGKNRQEAAVLESLPSDWLVYDEMTKATSRGLSFSICNTALSSACVALFAGPVYLSESDAILDPDNMGNPDGFPPDSDSESEDLDLGRMSTLSITNWIKITLEPALAHMIVQLRTKWYSLFTRRIRNPSKPWQQEDEAILSSVINILSSEDQTIGLTQPSGIGQRPRPVTHDDSGRSSQFIPRTPGSGKGNHTGATAAGKKQPKCLNFRGMPGIQKKQEESDTSTSNTTRQFCRDVEKDATIVVRRYFVITLNSLNDLRRSQAAGNIETSPEISSAFTKAVIDHEIYVFFAVKGVGQLQGFAKLEEPCDDVINIFSVHWLKTAALSSSLTQLTCNIWNSRIICYGLQEIDINLGDTLLKLWDLPQANC
ncbi:3'-5' RNA helicase YTHDC2-like isoform X2 [Clavelina lepadiformis]|uniref:3'-5' RNA helicase YTHDC2-like isoform X2 n=1 Tax=Clavelina lepadiformis TaxID=159417 RepID=UPI004042BEA0